MGMQEQKCSSIEASESEESEDKSEEIESEEEEEEDGIYPPSSKKEKV
jgi:hypothetical protein